MVANACAVLVVDDGATDRMRWDLIGRIHGLDVRTAADAKEAMASIAADRPDVVLMDLDMPGTDGISAARIIRNDPDLHDLPVVLHTGSPHTDAALATGVFDAFLGKHLDDATLVEGVLAVLVPAHPTLRARR